MRSLKIGLSWPSLSKALGRKVDDPSRWAVLYLGSAKVADLDTDAEIVAINRKGEVEPHQRAILSDIEGIVLLDGTWSQAKALWWRNAWMLKCQRVILGPTQPSRYGKLRKEPRRDGLSTIEAAAMLLAGAGKAAGYRRDAQRQFRADAGAISRSAGTKCRNSRRSRRSGITAAASAANAGFQLKGVPTRLACLARMSSVALLPARNPPPSRRFQCRFQDITQLWTMMTSLLTVINSKFSA